MQFNPSTGKALFNPITGKAMAVECCPKCDYGAMNIIATFSGATDQDESCCNCTQYAGGKYFDYDGGAAAVINAAHTLSYDDPAELVCTWSLKLEGDYGTVTQYNDDECTDVDRIINIVNILFYIEMTKLTRLVTFQVYLNYLEAQPFRVFYATKTGTQQDCLLLGEAYNNEHTGCCQGLGYYLPCEGGSAVITL